MNSLDLKLLIFPKVLELFNLSIIISHVGYAVEGETNASGESRTQEAMSGVASR
jgi:hypothetical protein